jgi:dTDP-glucose 4,6-dehydratase
MKTILVTGGCGFIGSCFIRGLLATPRPWKVVNVDKLTYAGNLHDLEAFWADDRLVFEQLDICDKERMRAVFRDHDIDVVVNFAAETHVDRSINDAMPFIQSNVCGTQTLLDLSIAAGVDRFVQVSTDEVYGALSEGEGESPFTEKNCLRPSNPYAASKAAADMLVMAARNTHGIESIITRCSNVYGPFQFPEKFIPVAIVNAMESKQVPVYGDGQNMRDWIHVEDHCNGIMAAIEKGRPGEIYNFGGGAARKNIDVVKEILQVMQKPGSLISFVPDRPGHDFKYAMNFQKAATELGWSPRVVFSSGLKDTVQWYKNNVAWIQGIKTGTYMKAINGYNERKRRT